MAVPHATAYAEDMSPTAAASHEPHAKQQRWLEVALILLVCFVHGGAPAPAVNESHYLPKAKHYWQPEWCAGDAFLESADAHLVFYWTIGWLTKLFSLSTVAWIGRVAAWLAFAWSWQRLCATVLRARFSSVLAAALFVWLTSKMNFAGEWVVGGVEGKCFAYACVFAGLTNLSQGNWHRLWPWLGLGSAFHALVGGWSAIAAGIVWFLEPRDKRPHPIAMMPALTLGALLALPGLVPALQLSLGVTVEESREAARIYVFERLPHHLAPLTEAAEYMEMRTMRFALPLFAFLLLWVFLLLRQNSDSGGSQRAALVRICKFTAASFLISFVGLLWELATVNHPLLSASLLRYYWFRLADVGVPLAAVLLTGFWTERLFERRAVLSPIVLIVTLLLAGKHLVGTSFDRYQNPVSPAEKKTAAAIAWQDACDWAQQNSPVDALFLVPRGSQSLSWHASRRSLVTWKDVPQDASSLIEWFAKYQDVFLYEDEFGEIVPYDSLAVQGTQRIRYLADKYKIDFVITREYPPLEFPEVYGNAWYTIYRVQPTESEQRSEQPHE